MMLTMRRQVNFHGAICNNYIEYLNSWFIIIIRDFVKNSMVSLRTHLVKNHESLHVHNQ